MSRAYNWQVTIGPFAAAQGQHTQWREARRAMHRALRKFRGQVHKQQRDAVGSVYRWDQVLMARTDMTPVSILNPPVRWLIVKQYGPRLTSAIHRKEGIRPS